MKKLLLLSLSLLFIFTLELEAQTYNLDVVGDGIISDDLRVGDTLISSSSKVYLIDEQSGNFIFGTRAGALELWDSDFQFGIFPNPGVNEFDRKIELRANQNVSSDREPIFNMYNEDEKKVFTVDVQSNGHAVLEMDGANNSRIYLDAEGSASAPYMYMYNDLGQRIISFDSDVSNGANFELRRGTTGTGSESAILLESDVAGDARVTTDELLIRGGSDLAEHFDVASESGSEVSAGLVVSIDPTNPGKLIPTTSAYDKGVVGVISGANGVEAGMMMGQAGTIADGDYPIALVGRVYVKANQLGGDIKPGDFLTSSDIRGEAMKVKKAKKGKGAVIGKALTSIDENGYVLVLVNLQ